MNSRGLFITNKDETGLPVNLRGSICYPSSDWSDGVWRLHSLVGGKPKSDPFGKKDPSFDDGLAFPKLPGRKRQTGQAMGGRNHGSGPAETIQHALFLHVASHP